MTATLVGERWDSRKATLGWQNSTGVLTLIICGTEDDSEVAAIADTYAGTTYGDGLLFQNYTMEHEGGGNWLVNVNYSTKEPKNTGDSTYNFDTGGGQTKISQSITTVNSYANGGGTAPNHHSAIGVTSEGIEGCDITSPVYNFSETHYIAVASVTSDYKAALFALTGKTNNDSWRGFNAGEVLFLGASGTQRGKDDWEISFKFAASQNATGLSLGPITGIAKKGWEYLWVSYIDAKDTGATPPAMVKKPVAAYVEQVYYSGDFTTLGIGS